VLSVIRMLWMRKQVAKAASMSLNSCVNCLPGLREVDEIVKHVSTVSVKLSTTSQVCFSLIAFNMCYVADVLRFVYSFLFPACRNFFSIVT